jgi:hypothetical protein
VSRNSLATLCLSLVILSSGAAWGQVQNDSQSSGDRAALSAQPDVAATAGNDQVRFVSLGVSRQLRLEVIDQGGNLVYDSEFRAGTLLDWKIEDRRGRRLSDGLYGCTVTLEDLAGARTYRRGVFWVKDGAIVFAEHERKGREAQIGATYPDSLTVLLGDEALPLTQIGHSGKIGLLASNKGGLSFRTGDFFGGKDIEQMRLTAEGNLGLGTEEPAAKLDVAGIIRAQGIQFPDGTIQKTAGASAVAFVRDMAADPVTGGMRSADVFTATGVLRLRSANRTAGSGLGRVNGSEGSTNTFYGDSAGVAITDGTYNSFFGARAGNATTTGSNNSFFAAGAGGNNTSGAYNSFFGRDAGLNSTTANGNAFFGATSGTSNISGQFNAFFGADSGFSNNGGDYNVLIGAAAGFTNTNGFQNTFVGGKAGYFNTSGFSNAFSGYTAGYRNTSGNSNSSYGFNAGYYNTTGSGNSFIGSNSGPSNTVENNNTFLGANSNGGSSITNATAIGYQSQVSQSNSLVLGSISGINGATSDTNVGIGTTTPDRLLVLEGTQALARFTRINESGSTFSSAFLFERARGTRLAATDILAGDSLGKVQFRGRVNGNMAEYAMFSFIATDANQNGRFSFVDRDLATERVSILNTGNVGIGTTNPTERLHVVGNIRLSGSILTAAPEEPLPDYVFEPNYKLMSIEQLESFIKREKHLPNVPKATDMRRDGLNVAQFQMKLLEKIEELTVYVVQQAKTIREQQGSLDSKNGQVAALEAQNVELDARLAALEARLQRLVNQPK